MRKALLFLIVLLFLAGFLLGGLFIQISRRGNSLSQYVQNTIGVGLTEAEKSGKSLSNGQCVGNEKRKLTTLPMKYEDFSIIIPYGLVVGDHVTPIDHQYFSPAIFRSPRDMYEVRAMADSTIVEIQPRVKPEYTEYRFVFSISCSLFYYYDLVTSLSPDIKKVFDESDEGTFKKSLNIPVKAGQVIGRIGGQTLDFAVWDTEKILPGFVNPKSYEEERWKIHTVDPLEYYTDELKTQVLSKYIRTTEPVSGRIDYDIDGRLVGNWFVAGTNGYQGLKRQRLEGYSKTHLAVVPNHIDPLVYMISFGNFNGQFKQFAAKKDSLDPTQVGIENGMVKYELFDFDYLTENGDRWSGLTFARNLKTVVGTVSNGCVVFQLVDTRSLKMEAFPAKSCRSVFSFSSQAVMYER